MPHRNAVSVLMNDEVNTQQNNRRYTEYPTENVLAHDVIPFHVNRLF